MHLDRQSYDALLAGTIPPGAARALSAHLDGECERCDRFLAEARAADGFDGLTDAALARAMPTAGGEGNDVEFARILREVGRRSAARPRRILSAAVAASLLVAGVAGVVAWRSGSSDVIASLDGVKGRHARAIPVRLRFLDLGVGGAIQKGISGEVVSSSSSLLFEVEAGRAANVALVRVGSAGDVEVLWRSRIVAGRTQVTAAGRPAGYPLQGLTGAQRFVLVASDEPLDLQRTTSAASALSPPAALSADAPALDGLSLDVIEVSVR